MDEKKKKVYSLVLAVGLIGVSVLIIGYTSWPERKFSPGKAYFTDDDGKTWYEDSNDNIPPYQHNGKEAVGAIIYRTAKSSKPFCGFLFRFPANVKSQIEKEGVPPGTPGKSRSSIAYGPDVASQREVKAINSKGKWVPIGSSEGIAVMSVQSPDGSELDQVVP